MNDEEWNYQDEEFDDSLPYIELQFGPEDLYHVYECVKYRYCLLYTSDAADE